jgi:hemin uptake protein HemP
MSRGRMAGKRKMQNNPLKESDDKKNKKNISGDEGQLRSQAGQSEVTHESAGGQYHMKKDKLGKVEDRNEGKGHKAPDISTPNVEGGRGGSVYEKGNRTPYAARAKKPRHK